MSRSYAISKDLRLKARIGAVRMGASSCATRHGLNECMCSPSDVAHIMCDTCGDFTKHRFALDAPVGADSRSRYGALYEELFECTECGCRRQYGLSIEPRR